MYETAAGEFAEALKAAPGHAAILCNLGAMRLSQRKKEAALESLEAAVASSTDSPRAFYLLGRALAAVDRRDEAEAALKKAADLDPSEPETVFRLSELYLAWGRTAEAEAQLRRVLAARPEHGPALNRLARLLGSEGKRDESERLLRRFAAAGRRRVFRGRYDEPIEPAESRPGGGPRWLEVKAVATRSRPEAVVTVLAGRLVLQRMTSGKPVRFELGDKAKADAVRVDWSSGEHSYKLDVPSDGVVVIREITTSVW